MMNEDRRGQAILTLRRTAYYVTWPDGTIFADTEGHMYFSKTVAHTKAQHIGGMYHDSGNRDVKTVVIGYNPAK